MNIKGFSQKHSVALFWTAIVLAVLLIIGVLSGFGGRGAPSGGMPGGDQNMPQAQGQNQPMQQADQGGSQQGAPSPDNSAQQDAPSDGGPQQGAPNDGSGAPQQ